jgi:5-methylcytosine-specific restriction endonuclease McrA
MEGASITMAEKQPQLTIEMVPSTQWGASLANALRGPRWDTLRKEVYRQAGYCCEICGGKGEQWPVEAHEVWSYDDERHVQRLDRMVALCPSCHEVKHYGRATRVGTAPRAFEHLRRVNGWTEDEANAHIEEAWTEWERRSQHKWTLDLAVLRDYGVEPPTAAEIEAAHKRRIEEVGMPTRRAELDPGDATSAPKRRFGLSLRLGRFF